MGKWISNFLLFLLLAKFILRPENDLNLLQVSSITFIFTAGLEVKINISPAKRFVRRFILPMLMPERVGVFCRCLKSGSKAKVNNKDERRHP